MIYALKDPRTKKVKYVGCTFQWRIRRLRQHTSSTKLACLRHWLEELAGKNLEPIFVPLENAPRCTARIREAYWMHRYVKTILNKNKKLHWVTN
jgi:hypothetical protein